MPAGIVDPSATVIMGTRRASKPRLGERIIDVIDVRLCACASGGACLCHNCECGPSCTCHH